MTNNTVMRAALNFYGEQMESAADTRAWTEGEMRELHDVLVEAGEIDPEPGSFTHEHEFTEEVGQTKDGRAIYACGIGECPEVIEGGTEWKDQSK